MPCEDILGCIFVGLRGGGARSLLGRFPPWQGRGSQLVGGGLVDPVGVEGAGGTNPLRSSNEDSESVSVLELSDSPSSVRGGDGRFRGFLALSGALIVAFGEQTSLSFCPLGFPRLAAQECL